MAKQAAKQSARATQPAAQDGLDPSHAGSDPAAPIPPRTSSAPRAGVTKEPEAHSASAPAAYQVLARRYRSRDFGEVVGQEATARTLQNAIRTGRTAHAYLFTGTRGVGKTSMARIFAQALNAPLPTADGSPDIRADEPLIERDAIAGAIMRGEDLDVIEIDAASNRGIDNARDLIAGAGLMPARGRYKIYIIDEVHMLTTPAFNALLKTMEEPPAHVKFILCTTEPQSVPATIQSRCQRFDFKNIPTTRIADHLRDVVARERTEADERVILQIARLANGSMRDALSLMERLLAAAEPDGTGTQRLTWQLLDDIFGLPDETLLERVLESIAGGDAAAALVAGGELLERGLSIERALDLIAERLRWVMLTQVCGRDTSLLEVAAETREVLERIAQRFAGHGDASASAAGLVHLIALADSVAAKARDSSSPRALYDAALVRMSLAESFASATSVLAVGALASGSGTGGPPIKKAVARPAELPTRPAPSIPRSGSVAVPEVVRPSSPSSAPATREPAPGIARPDERLGAIEAKPLGEHSESALWAEITARAAASPRDRALLAGLVFRSHAEDTLHLAVEDGEAGSAFLAGGSGLLQSTIDRLAGRHLTIKVHVAPTPAQRAAPSPRGPIPQSIREHPTIRMVSDLFDASVVDLHPLRREAGAVPADESLSGAMAAPHAPSGAAGAEEDHDV